MVDINSSRVLTRADLDALPDDLLRHELIDGHFVMTPAPGVNHQTASLRLMILLDAQVRGSALMVLTAIFDVVLGPHVVKPDLIVAPKADFTERDLPVAPLLVVEILTTSTLHLDRGRKREIYAEAGVPHYWIVDPDEPSITVLELADGAYVEVGHAVDDQVINIERPVALHFAPADLLRD